jgi:hypothetical protein
MADWPANARSKTPPRDHGAAKLAAAQSICGFPVVSRLLDMRISGSLLQQKMLGRFFLGN